MFVSIILLSLDLLLLRHVLYVLTYLLTFAALDLLLTFTRVVTFSLLCDQPSRYCIEYSNGTLHDVLTFELLVVVSAVFAIVGYVRASMLFQSEQEREREQSGNENIGEARDNDSANGDDARILAGTTTVTTLTSEEPLLLN
jgi:hypothetical protein